MSEQTRRERSTDVAESVDHYTATTIPVHLEVDAKHVVLNLGEAERVLRAADSIALGPCDCRQEKRNCSAPIDVCLALNENCNVAVATREGFRRCSVEEALDALRTSHEAGLVHLAYRKPSEDTTVFCSCCSCCCWFLNALKRFDYRDAIVESSHIVGHDVDRCVGCGTCVERCPFGAWTLDRNEHKPTLHSEKCFGCGLCVSTCAAGAISFVPREATAGGVGQRP